MNQRYPQKKVGRGRPGRFIQSNNSDNKNNYRSQDNYSTEKKRVLSDVTFYNIARFLMGNEVAIVTKNERVEGVLRGFDSFTVWLSKVFVYDLTLNESLSFMKDILEGKDIFIRDILMIKVLNTNGKTESVLVDEEISQRKQPNKLLQSDDKNLVPYFDEYEGHLDEEKDENDDMGISSKGDQCCWYNPEVMMKVNEEKFHLKSTYNDNMEEYTTQIDRTDPLLREKIERAEKLAREMENDSSLRRVRPFEDDDGEQDEENMFSSVVTSVPPPNNKLDVSTTSASTKLNPNAPEFRPRIKSDTFDHQHMQQQLEDIPMPNIQIMSVESVQQQQMIPIESVQQQQMSLDSATHQQILQRLAFSMTPHTVATQPCQGQRLLSTTPPQWTVPMHNNSPGQYMIQPYLQHGQLMPQVFQTRQMAPEGTQNSTPGLIYSLSSFQGIPAPLLGSLQGQFFVQPDHSSSAINDGQQHHPHHMYASSLDVVPAQIQQQQLRQPHLMPANIPVLQAAASASQFQQLQQQSLPQAHHTYYTQSPHNHPIMTGGQQINTGGHATFSQLIFNPQAQQLQSGAATIQGYLPPPNNGRP